MKKVIIYLFVLLLFLFVGLSPVYAGYKEGGTALDRSDYETAFKEFEPLAMQGSIWSQYNIGLMYSEGKGVPKDYAEAFKWYKKAAEQGLLEAQNSLGVIYAKGEGVPKDYVMAYKWFSLAATRLEPAIKNKSMIEKDMTPEQIAEAQRLSREFEVKKP